MNESEKNAQEWQKELGQALRDAVSIVQAHRFDGDWDVDWRPVHVLLLRAIYAADCIPRPLHTEQADSQSVTITIQIGGK